ncbi:MBL fold metallo-hydrolase [Enterobacter sichuanensis]
METNIFKLIGQIFTTLLSAGARKVGISKDENMQQIYPDLWQTEAEHPFFGVTSHAYLLLRDDGNILFYSFGRSQDHARIEALGGIAFQFLSHRDEAGTALAEIKKKFGSRLVCHRREEAAIKRYASVDELFDTRETRFGNVEIIPTPGHTDGSVCFFVRSPHGKNYLFTGDTIYMNHGKWEVRISQSDEGTRSDIRKSLLILRDLGPAVVISSASQGSSAYKEVSGEEWASIIDDVLGDLQ